MSKNKFTPGQLVYFLCPQASNLQTQTLKFNAMWTGPLIIASVVDSNHVILKNLNGRILYGLYSTKRIKPAYIWLKNSVASTIEQLRKGLGHKQNISTCHLN